MGIVNRTLDASERQDTHLARFDGPVAVSQALPAWIVPHPSKLKSAHVAAKGLSGTPVYQLQVRRWTSAGVTVIALGAAATVAAAFGVSGSTVDMTVYTGGSAVQLEAKDMIEVASTGANTASDDLAVAMVIERLQDIKSEFGSES